MAINSWWENANDRLTREADFRNSGGYQWSFGSGANTPLLEKPSDWEDFRKDFGGGFATSDDYKNWGVGKRQSREQDAFVDKYSQDVPGFSSRMNEFLDAPGPTASNENRFEEGLSKSEQRLASLLDDPDSIQQSAAYKFRVGQGQEALQRQLAAKGMLGSGNRLMELTKYGQDMASQEYDNQANRLQNLLGTYSQSWLGDKNANTARYAAESDAWGTRGATLADLYNNATRNRSNLAMKAYEPTNTGTASRSSWGMNPVVQSPLSNIGGSWNPATDPTIQRMERDAGWNYQYGQGGNSLWSNSATGESQWAAGGREGKKTLR
jgi:hypothetical protein